MLEDVVNCKLSLTLFLSFWRRLVLARTALEGSQRHHKRSVGCEAYNTAMRTISKNHTTHAHAAHVHNYLTQNYAHLANFAATVSLASFGKQVVERTCKAATHSLRMSHTQLYAKAS